MAQSSSTLAPRLALLAGLYASVAAGSFYGFGLYSEALRIKFDLSPAQLENINTLPYVFGLVSALMGKLGRWLGTKMTLAVGGLVVSGAQVTTYLIATETIKPPHPPETLVAVAVLTFLGSALISSCASTAPIFNLPSRRGEAIALVKSFVGLGGEVVAQLFVLFFGSHTSDPTAFNALLLYASVILGCTLAAALIVPSQPEPASEEPHRLLRVLFYELLALGCFSVAVALVPYGPLHNFLVVPMITLALLPIPLSFVPQLTRPGVSRRPQLCRQGFSYPSLVSAASSPDRVGSTTSTSCIRPPRRIRRSSLPRMPDRKRIGSTFLLSSTSTSSRSDEPTLPSDETPANPPELSVRQDTPPFPRPLQRLQPDPLPSAEDGSPFFKGRHSGEETLVEGPSSPATSSASFRLESQGSCTNLQLTGGGAAVRFYETSNPRNLRQLLVSPDAWLLWVVGAVVIGGGNLIATNISQIIRSCGGDDGIVPRAVTVFSAGNQLGRLTSIIPSNHLVRNGHSRLICAAGISTLMTLAHAIFFFAAYVVEHGSQLQAACFIFACFAGGLSFGAIWPHLVLLASELFGSANLAVNYMFFDGVCSAVGTLALANFLPRLFNRVPDGSSSTCTGRSCFGITHGIVVILCLLSVGASMLIALRTKLLYRRIGNSMRQST